MKMQFCSNMQRDLFHFLYPKKSSKFNSTSNGFSCNLLDLVVKQSQGISCDIFDKPQLQPEYAGMSMITMPHVQSNISISAKLGVISCSFQYLYF